MSWPTQRRAQKGIATMEAALVMPLLALIMVLAIDISNLLITDQRLVRATRNMADLIAREAYVDDDRVDAIEQASNTIFSPFDDEEAGYGVANVVFDDNGDERVSWQRSFNGGDLNNPIAKADRIALEVDSVVVVRGSYEWQPLIGHPVLGSVEIEEVQVARPRLVREVEYR